MELTHEVLVVVVVGVVDDPDAVALVEAAETADAEPLAVHGGTTLEAGLAQALVQALAEGATGDLRVELRSRQPTVAVPLERGVRPPAAGEQVRRQRVLRELAPLSCIRHCHH